MSATTTVRDRVVTQVSPAIVLTVAAATNTVVLIALDRAGMIPSWLKLAAAAFLGF